MKVIRKKLLGIFACMLLLCAVGQMCVGKEIFDVSGDEPLVILMYEPHSHDFGDMFEGETDSTVFEIWRSGGCCSLTYTIYETCEWIEVFPTSGESHGEHDPITVTINTTGLEPASYAEKITIVSNGGSGIFTVTVTVLDKTHPYLGYAPESYDFGDMAEGKTDSTVFEIWNKGGDLLTYTLTEECTWIDVFPTSGGSQGEHDPITVSINTTGLERGPHTCDIAIESNGGDKIFDVDVNIIVNPSLSYAPESYDFGDMGEGETDSTVFEIWNKGGDVLTYTLTSECGWVSVSPTSGESKGEHDPIVISVDTTGLKIDFYTCDISIESNGGNGVFTVTVNVVGAAEIEIEISGGLGVTATIKNVGDVDAVGVEWSITLDGGFILFPPDGTANGIIDIIPSGEEFSVQIFVLGFGNTVITVTANDVEKTADGFVLLFFVLGVQ